MMHTASSRAEAGAALLDQHMPGWADRIDLSTLDIRSGAHCIIGQLQGSYSDDCARITDDPVSYGFTAGVIAGLVEVPTTSMFKELTEAWRPQVAKRKKVLCPA